MRVTNNALVAQLKDEPVPGRSEVPCWAAHNNAPSAGAVDPQLVDELFRGALHDLGHSNAPSAAVHAEVRARLNRLRRAHAPHLLAVRPG